MFHLHKLLGGLPRVTSKGSRGFSANNHKNAEKKEGQPWWGKSATTQPFHCRQIILGLVHVVTTKVVNIIPVPKNRSYKFWDLSKPTWGGLRVGEFAHAFPAKNSSKLFGAISFVPKFKKKYIGLHVLDWKTFLQLKHCPAICQKYVFPVFWSLWSSLVRGTER